MTSEYAQYKGELRAFQAWLEARIAQLDNPQDALLEKVQLSLVSRLDTHHLARIVGMTTSGEDQREWCIKELEATTSTIDVHHRMDMAYLEAWAGRDIPSGQDRRDAADHAGGGR